MKNSFYLLITVQIFLGLVSCSGIKEKSITEESSDEKTSEDWIMLFDGTSLKGWRGFNADSLPPNWVLEDNSLKSLGTGGDIGGDIVYAAEEFENFELYFEWKISEGGNSGVFYHVIEGEQYEAPYENAPEYQVLDDIGFPSPLEEWQKVGADYAMHFAEPGTKEVKSAGEWNSSKIYFTPERAEHWLNGKKLLSFVPWSNDWMERKNSWKWYDYPDYGKAKSGFIGIQDHGSFIWYRNIKIRRL